MPLPQPNLDDRHFQQLVDEAKLMVQERCREWTDHNVSDPGITLIETFAYMIDQLGYRLNRVPDKNYLAFLDLIGVRLFPPAAARAEVTFWLSAPQAEPVTVPAGAEVATARTAAEPAVVFAVDEELAILPCELSHLATESAGTVTDRDSQLADGDGVPCFQPVPQPDDAVYFGLSRPVPRCAVALRVDAPVSGHGISPTAAPLAWEAWTDDGWTRCEVHSDDTWGFNRPGDVIVHLPAGHVSSVEAGHRAGWLRCLVVPVQAGRSAYTATPGIISVRAFTVGGTTPATHAETVGSEELEPSEGVPGQQFTLSRRPLVAGGEPVVLESAGRHGVELWYEVDDFGESGAEDRHFRLDRATGEITLGPLLREPDGTVTRRGAVPERGAVLRISGYRIGGGRRGNVAQRTLVVSRTSVPFVARVENRAAATGGVDGEDIGNARLRGPMLLRNRDRAVTAEDYEVLAREAAPEVARVRCVATESGPDAGGVRVLLVPAAEDDGQGRLDFFQLAPSPELAERVTRFLDARRLLGTRLLVEPPNYLGVSVVTKLQARRGLSRARLREDVLTALYRHLNPLVGGPTGDGWPFGRTVQLGEVFALLQRLPGVELVDWVKMFSVDLIAERREEPVDRIELAPHELAFSFRHEVRFG